MITSLISAIVGLISGIVPDAIKEFTAGRAHTREVEFLKLQNEMAIQRSKTESEDKLREAHEGELAAEVAAFRSNLHDILEQQGRPTGVAWIDGFSALLRPVTCLLIIVLFMATASIYVQGVVHSYNSGQIKDSVQFANVIWNSMLGESVQAVLGFLFGYRSSARR